MASDALTIHEAAATTGWSSRMLRYIEEAGLVVPRRSLSGYRLYGPAELQRLRTLRELLVAFGIELSDVGFALRLRDDDRLREGLEAWFSSEAVRPARGRPGAVARLRTGKAHPVAGRGRGRREQGDRMSFEYKVADLSLAEFGRKEIQLAEHEMPGLMATRREHAVNSR